MKIRELLLCAVDPTDPGQNMQTPNSLSSAVAPVGAVESPKPGTTPVTTNPVQMANNAPAPMMPNDMMNWATAQQQKANTIATGPLGAANPFPAGSSFSDMAGRPPIPLK